MSVLQEYKCPCCDGAITFDSTIQKMKCPYCDTEFSIETIKGYADNLSADSDDNINWNESNNDSWQDGEDGLAVYVCDSCGGEIVGDDTLAASSCPFCGTPIIMRKNLTGVLKPDFVIPFKLDKKAATQALKNHFKGKRLLPKSFSKDNHIEEIKGMYVPFWLYDADVDASMRYRAQNVRFWSDSRYDYTETSHYSLRRSGSISFERIPVDGSTKMDDKLMESVEPFNFKDAVSFESAYLAGYLADKYDVSSAESMARATERLKHTTEEAFRATTSNFQTVTCESSSIKTTDSSVKYALFPIWLLNTKWNGEIYTFVMNGQTGKLAGDLPVDKKAAWRYGISIAAAVSVGVYAVAWLLRILGMF